MAGIIIRSTGVEIYYITTRRSNHMKLMDKAKQAALVAAVKQVWVIWRRIRK